MYTQQLIESPLTRLADATVGDRVGPLAAAAEPTLCVVAGTIVGAALAGVAVVIEGPGIAALLTAAAASAVAGGVAVAAGGNGDDQSANPPQ